MARKRSKDGLADGGMSDESEHLEQRRRQHKVNSKGDEFDLSDRRDRNQRKRDESDGKQYGHRSDRDDRNSERGRTSRGQRSPHRRRSRSPVAKRRRRSYSASRSHSSRKRSRVPLPSQNESFLGEVGRPKYGERAVEKQKPNFKPTGLLAKEANRVEGTTTVLKYHEPPEARKPQAKEQWRMYIFKGKDLLDTVQLYQRSCWLMGRDQKVTDMLLEHPSISKQHAVIQFRHLNTTNEYGDKTSNVKPYVIDLESANGTKLNGQRVETTRFIELVDGDVIAFGDSEREYVMMLPPP